MNIVNKSKVIECIAKENYENFCNAIMETENVRNGRIIVIFGAGILGMQFAYTMQSLGINDFVFCDNDTSKWGKEVCNKQVFSPEVIINCKKKYFIFLAIEDYCECVKQLEEGGLTQKRDWYNLKNYTEVKLVEDLYKDWNASILVLGDCTVTNISIEDEIKSSLKDLLYRKDKVKVLAMNGIYMRTLYNIFLMNLSKMGGMKKVVILLNIDIFGNKYHLLSKNQHGKVFKEIFEFLNISDIEVKDFVETIKKREANTSILNYISPDRTENISDNKIEQGRRIHMKLNYLYDLMENNESVQYLDKMMNKCLEYNIIPYFVFMPVNWEMGEKYFGNMFYEKYNRIKDVIYDHIIDQKGKVLDLSYFLTSDDFICIRSTNEGIREKGRIKIAKIVMNELGVIK